MRRGMMVPANDVPMPQCFCGIPTPLRQCKNGPNRGKLFWGCANFPNDRCKFFAWAVTEETTTSRGSTQAHTEDTATSRGKTDVKAEPDEFILAIKKLKQEVKAANVKLETMKTLCMILMMLCVFLSLIVVYYCVRKI